ncbi:hypothetical protein GCM10007291_07280 [Gemmobacter nanjingensis]|jgi:hypothetical protein|uniref:Uncharacterized protein n=1 Tax=Gemmobacter nanjingensis TaxID=488454 RepID=A0ABQ3F7Y1_9RHOB|nr:hypothetical protein [Gemmobacter nanjingensis]GHC12558.1 hypothetical protein GCM10007291_07280 [Gemmobacter nanjingensis]
MTTQIRSIGDLVAVKRAAANTAVTAGGSGDNTEVAGVIIDRAAIGFPQSCVVAIPFTATLAAAATLTIAFDVDEGNDSALSDAEVLTSATAAVVATGPSGGGTVAGTFEANVSLAGAGRYVRLNFTPNLSAANTDTAALSAVIVFGGMDRLPQ